MARQAQCPRVRSVLTRQVNAVEVKNANAHKALPKVINGQLPFLECYEPYPLKAQHARLSVSPPPTQQQGSLHTGLMRGPNFGRHQQGGTCAQNKPGLDGLPAQSVP